MIEDKKMRVAENVAGKRKAATEILQLCFDAKDWKLLNEQILNLYKKHGQFKQDFSEVCIEFNTQILKWLVSCGRESSFDYQAVQSLVQQAMHTRRKNPN